MRTNLPEKVKINNLLARILAYSNCNVRGCAMLGGSTVLMVPLHYHYIAAHLFPRIKLTER